MEINDYDLDIVFGSWLRDRRTSTGMSIEEAASKSGITLERLRSLEIGYAEKGITHLESQKLSGIYKIDIKELITRASRTN